VKLELKNIIKPEFGPIRQVYYNKSVDAFLFETDYGFQFIYTDNKIIIDNVSQQFKIIGNTFSKGQVSFITKKGLHKIEIIDLVKKQTNSFGKWGDIDYTSIFIASLKFPFLQYYSGRLNSIEFSDRLILVDDQLGIICYNVLSEEIEFNFDISQNSVSSHFHPEIDNEIYWANIDKFEISEDEKYFYVLTAYEGKSLFVFRTTDYSLLYHEFGSYALSFGVFYNDNFVIPSGFDYDSDDKQPFKVINLLNGERQTIELDLELIQDFHFGAKFKNLVIAYNQLSNSETYNYSRCIQAINLNDIVNLKIITRKEININPQIVLNDDLLKDLFICDNHLIILEWNNNISLHLINYNEENDKEQLITSIYQTLEDYRADENRPNVRITTNSIRNWINQFDNDLRVPILTELDNIFKKRYCSKSKVKDFLDQVIQVLTKDFGFKSANEFLKNSDFLNLQPEGKSQKIMLSLFDELIQDKYRLSLADCGTNSKKYSIYIDDILCTGLTLISDIKDWSEQNFSANKTNGQAVADNSKTLVFAYVFIHEKNYKKKVAEMRHKISNDVSSKHKMYRLIEIENGVSQSSKIDLIFPLEEGQTDGVKEYQAEITNRVDQRANEKGWKTGPNEFYRPLDLPTNEGFFTTAENRKIVENAFLQKGIQILDNANSQIPNMRALGYSLPSLKDFGFGALCFTWRNVPNNAPLVFWYSGGGFTPLFKVTRGGNPIVNFNFVANPTTPDDDLTF
jgi:hypothetical protein